MRAYGMLLQAGFAVQPIMKNGPDFIVDQDTAVEVNARQEAAETLSPHGIAPFGAPSPHKQGDTVGSNVISKIGGIKGSEHQFSDRQPNVLWVDFGYLGLWPGVFKMDQAFPIASWNGKIYSGGLWSAFYGWVGCPIFEGLPSGAPKTRMQHSGRYRKPTKISGSVAITVDQSALFENPKPNFTLSESFRKKLLTGLDGFSLEHSIANWVPGTVADLVNAQAKNITAFDESPIAPTPFF
jgi:hypothetical protein